MTFVKGEPNQWISGIISDLVDYAKANELHDTEQLLSSVLDQLDQLLAQSKSSTWQILVLEEETSAALDLKEKLRALGHSDVELAEDYESAKDVLERYPITCAFLDLNLREYSTTHRIGTLLSSMKIPHVYTCSKGTLMDVGKFRSSVPRLQKPISAMALRRVLGDLDVDRVFTSVVFHPSNQHLW